MNRPGRNGPYLHRFIRFITFPLAFLAAFILIFEEWLWEPLDAAMHWIVRWPGLRWIERQMAGARPYAALALFVIPAIILLPFKLAGLWLIGSGHPFLGLLVFMAAKVVGTAVLAWILALTKPALLSISWFARLWDRFIAARTWLYARVTTSRPWRMARSILKAIRSAAQRQQKGIIGRIRLRWAALLRLLRRAISGRLSH